MKWCNSSDIKIRRGIGSRLAQAVLKIPTEIAIPTQRKSLIVPALVLACVLALATPLPSAQMAQGDSQQFSPPTEIHPQRPTTQNYGIVPSRGPAGTTVSVSGGGFRDFAHVESITMGGVDILGNRTVSTDGDGNFQIGGLLVPGFDPGVFALTIRVGTGVQETTAIGTFEITGPPNLPEQ